MKKLSLKKPNAIGTEKCSLFSRKNDRWIECIDDAVRNVVLLLEYTPQVKTFTHLVCKSIVKVNGRNYGVSLDFSVEYHNGDSKFVCIKRKEKFPAEAYARATKGLTAGIYELIVLNESELRSSELYRNLDLLWSSYCKHDLGQVDFTNLRRFFEVDYLLTIGEARNICSLEDYDEDLAEALIFHQILQPDIEHHPLDGSLPIIRTNFHCLKNKENMFFGGDDVW